jgi:hypothetical protein
LGHQKIRDNRTALRTARIKTGSQILTAQIRFPTDLREALVTMYAAMHTKMS